MKAILPYLILSVIAMPVARAQQPAEALLIDKQGESRRVWIISATPDAFRFKESAGSEETQSGKTADFDSIDFLEPPALTEAIELCQSRNYNEAKDKLATVKSAFKDLGGLPDNPSTAAAYLELECLRKSGDLDALAKALAAFDKTRLTRGYQLRQLELYALWDAVRTKDWSRLEKTCKIRLKERMPGFQRAQVAYCLGLAQAAQDQRIPAINAFNLAITADAGASEEITRNATVNALHLYQTDPEVQAAMKRWGSLDENPASTGRQRLVEAAALAGLYHLSLGGGVPPDTEFGELLKYRSEPKPSAPVDKNEPGNDSEDR